MGIPMVMPMGIFDGKLEFVGFWMVRLTIGGDLVGNGDLSINNRDLVGFHGEFNGELGIY